MAITVAATIGLSIWLILWSLGAKSFDAFMITVTIVFIAVGVKMAMAYLPDRDAIDE